MPVRKYILLTTSSGSTWTVPSDWNSKNNIIHLIGGGGSGITVTGIAFAAGGGGGGYTKVSNYAAVAGTTVSFSVGAQGAPWYGTANKSIGYNAGGTTTFGGYSAGGGSVTGYNAGGVGSTANGGAGGYMSGAPGSAPPSWPGGGAGGPFGNGLAPASSSAAGRGDAGVGGDTVTFNGYEIWPGIAGSGAGAAGLYGGGGYAGGGNGAPGAIIIEYAPANFTTSDGDELRERYVSDYATIDEQAMTGSLWSWGYDSMGQLGDNTTVGKSSPVQTIATGTNWKLVSGGHYHAAAIKTDGTLWLWGRNNYGQLGNNTTTNRSSPVQTIAVGTNWKQVSCGTYYTAAIKTDGSLWLWGLNNYGQLGDSSLIRKSSPVQTISGGTNWKQVSIGASHTAAIKTDGTLWSWGSNSTGQLGDNTIVNKSSPVQTIAVGANWRLVSNGYYHTSAIKTDGTLWSWGFNSLGGLGDNTTVSKSSPVQTIAGGTNWKFVENGRNYTLAIKTDGTLWLWGNNNYGQLGDNTIVNKSSPVQTIAAGTNWKLVSGGYNSTSAIKTDGSLWTWGYNSYGELGDNSLIRKSSPVQTISGGTNWKQVSCGYNHTSAIHFYDAGNLYASN